MKGGGTVKAWAAFLPDTLTSLTVVISTDKATYTREIPTCNRVFRQNARNTLTINMDSAVREEFVATATLPFDDGFDAVSGNATEIKSLDNFAITGKVYAEGNGIIRLGKSGASGVIESKDKFDLSEPFHIILYARGWDSDEVDLTVTAGSQSQALSLSTSGTSATFEKYVLNFNAEAFPATIKIAPKTRIYIDRIQIISGEYVPIPEIVTDERLSVVASGDVCTVKYLIRNPVDGQQISVHSDQPWLNSIDTSVDGEISFIVDENTSESERTANLTVSYQGSESVIVAVTQAGVSASGEVLLYSFETVNYNVGNSSYAGNCDIVIDGITWNVVGNVTLSDGWGIGGKSLTNVDRTVYTKTSYPKPLTKVALGIGAVDSELTVNSVKLLYSTNADFTDAVSIESADSFASNTTLTFAGQFPENCYYKFVFNVSVKGTKNKKLILSKVDFWGMN